MSGWGDDPIVSDSELPESKFHALMDKTFGPGKWRLSGGYRSAAREDELRREGAQTVAPGHLSRHSEGTPDAPGAFDVVVDGLSPAQVADRLNQTGAKFHKLYPEGYAGGQGPHLHVEPIMDTAPPEHDTWGNDPVVKTPTPTPATKPRPTPLERAQAGAAALAQAGGRRAWDAASGEVSRDFMQPLRKLGGDVVNDINASVTEMGKPGGTGAGQQAREAGILGDVANVGLNALGAPFSALIHGAAALGADTGLQAYDPNPMAYLRKGGPQPLNREQTKAALESVLGDAAMAVPALKGERTTLTANAAQRASLARRNALPAPQRQYQASVQRLAQEGVELTPGQIKGGEARRAEQENKSSRYTGEAHRQMEQSALDSFNRAAYDRALAPLGVKYQGKSVGREGIDSVAATIGAAYERVLPKARAARDEQFNAGVAQTEAAYDRLLGPYKGAFSGIVETRVLARMGPDGVMDGRTFKQVESELNTLSRKYRMSNDGAQHLLAEAIDELNATLLDSMERNSPANIRPQLRRANTAWAIYKRLESASSRRPGSLGRFSTMDLLQGVKKGATQGAFARGDALLQTFADDAHRVMGDVVADSGTAGRLNRTRAGVAGAVVGEAVGQAVGGGPVGGALGAAAGAMVDRAAGGVTNALKLSLLRSQARRLNPASVRNYSDAAARRASRTNYLPIVAAGQDQQR